MSHLSGPQLNATPLIDVLLVLLVMLIFTLPVATHSVRVNLPHGRAGTPPPRVRLEIMYGGDLYWNGERVATLEQLTPRLADIARSADTQLAALPEKRAPYERVAQVLAAAQRQHVNNLGVSGVPD